ncbi:MAG: flagellar hook-length control protein FliK [Lachnospiraceae bacterium]|nr:flagellar hook-length control protein FliK [Lachnospiraceae bacterium]
MVTNSIKATGYMYLSSNATTKTQNKSQDDFANVMEKAGENHQNNSVKSTQKSSDTNSKTDTSQKVSKEESEKDVSVQENKTQGSEASETKPAENEKPSADTVKTEPETEAEADNNIKSEDFTKAAENLVQFQVPVQVENEGETVLDNIADETVSTVEDGAWQVMKQVLNRLAESLQVSTEDLQTSMKNLNMDMNDLQEPQNLLKLIVDVKDLKGPEELLTVTGLSETFKELNTELKDILKDQTEPVNQEYDSSVGQEELSANTKVSQAMTENNDGETGSKEQKASDSSERVFSSNLVQNHSTENPILVQQMNFNDRVQELLAERMDVQTSESIVKQVLEQVKLNIKTDVTSVQMQLYPEHLGKVAIQVVSKNGVLTAQIATENESAKAALESQLNILKESFDNQGLKVQSVEVMVSSRGFDQNTDTNSGSSDNQKQGRRIRKSLLEELDGREEEPEEEDLKSALGNTVSYTA